MTCRLIRLDLFDHLSSPVRAKMKCCKSHDLFSCQIKDCSATRIPFLSITGCHPWPTGSLIVFYSSAEVQSAYSTAPADWAEFSMSTQFNCQKHFYFKLFKQLYITIQFSVSTVSMSKTFLFQIIQFSISTQFKCKYSLIVKNIPISSYSV